MRITAARFLGAAAAPGGGPPPGPPEVAIAGRSNVGKSSLINSLTGRRGLARTSSTPGRTRQLNFFLLNDDFVLVDLPGYGFAVGPEKDRLSWGPLVESYLVGRTPLKGAVVIVDVRRGIEAEEAQLLDFLRHHGIAAAVVATKVDKLGRAAAGKAMAAVGAGLGPDVPVVPFSARTGEGRDALWRIVRGWLGSPAKR